VRVAAVDAGTNSTRLLIADWDGQELTRVAARSHITRLGRGVDATGRLSAEGLDATIERLAEYRDLIVEHRAVRTIAVATSAARDASNADELIARGARVDMNLRVISGREEAEASYAGATIGMGYGEHLVIDVGGGSTELIVGSGGEVRQALSLDLGCVRLTERHLHHDPPTEEELAAIAGRTGTLVGLLLPDVEPIPAEAIAVGGTATTLGAILLDLDTYDPDAVDLTPMTRVELGEIRDRLARMTAAEIARIPVVQPGRADVLVAGAELFVALADVMGLESLVVRDRDMLDGLAIEAATAPS
jgi:exopolyphosphatase / guanosine-5'-triphosphate,3'-diphosphate pyrophosphatase